MKNHKCFILLFSFIICISCYDNTDTRYVKNEMIYVEGDKSAVQSFYICRYEVTTLQFCEFLNDHEESALTNPRANPYKWINLRDDYCKIDFNILGYYTNKPTYPVNCVYWEGAKTYCEWLSIKTGKKYRLPTAKEWIWAAKGGNESKGYIYSGSNKTEEVAHFEPNGRNMIYPIGCLKPNELGIYDMSGNVAEWSLDMKLCGGGINRVHDFFSNSSTNWPVEKTKFIRNGKGDYDIGFRIIMVK